MLNKSNFLFLLLIFSFWTNSIYGNLEKIEFKGKSNCLNQKFSPKNLDNSSLDELNPKNPTINYDQTLVGFPESPNFNPPPNWTLHSVLEQGQIFKIAIKERGIYRINKNYVESNFKINVNTINPKNIHIYGNGGKMLAESNSANRSDDLIENAIYVSGEDDNSFDNSDYILFYADGPDQQFYDPSISDFTLQKNVYTEAAYYYVIINNIPGLRITSAKEVPNSNAVYNTTLLSVHHQKELYNLLSKCNHGSGQNWAGEEISNSRELDFGNEFNISNIVGGSKLNISGVLFGRSNQTSQFDLSIYGTKISAYSGSVGLDCTEQTIARKANFNTQINEQGSSLNVQLTYPQNGASSEAWLDWLQVTANVQSIYQDKPLILFNPNSISDKEYSYSIKNGKPLMEVWRIKNGFVKEKMKTNFSGNIISFNDENTNKDINSYILFEPGSISQEPSFVAKVENQNIHRFESADLVIIYHPDFKEDVFRLVKHREDFSKFEVIAIDINDLTNEFSSGSPDPSAIRDFARMLYNRSKKFKYLLLFGDGSYDARHVNKKLNQESFIPVYETQESLDPIYAYPSDDYFGLLDDTEGEDLRGKLDISIGRIPTRTKEEAKNFVDKIIHYDMDPACLGDWRLNNLFMADDEDGNTHVGDMDRIADLIKTAEPKFNQEKIYFDAFEQITTPGGERYPEATKSIADAINISGNLISSYMGHGGPTGLAQERVLQDYDIKAWNNPDKMTLLITATCSFNAFDDPNITNAGEYSLHNKSGAIGLYSTVRAVYANDNYQLTRSVFEHLNIMINDNNNNPRHLTIGEILSRSKNDNASLGILENTRKFMLFGDPSQSLAFPKLKNIIASVNDFPLTQLVDTFKALDKVSVKGYVADLNDQLVSTFNGKLYITIYDKAIELKTRANDEGSRPYEFGIQKNIIFKGLAEVKNGKWEFSFIIPKDINYKFGQGKISLYASDEKSLDASGYTDAIIIGGFSNKPNADNRPPEIKLYMNTNQFKSGGITNENPKIYAEISDDLGINITGNSIGHDLTVVLDGNTQDPIILNNYFKSSLNNPAEGTVTYPLHDLEPGKHSITMTAWDISNKMAQANLDFYVINNDELVIEDVYNFPNPFSNETHFQFESNFTDLLTNVEIRIFSITGAPIKTLHHNVQDGGFRVADIIWDGKTDNGADISSGVYVYRLFLKYHGADGILEKNSDFRKLMFLK